MMMLKRIALALALVGLAAPALAHTTVASTSPKSGSILPASPAEVSLTFREPARLTSAVVVATGQAERKLAFTPTGSAKTFTLKAPALASGRNEIQWKALSKDGHAISGSIIVVIKPGAVVTAPADHAAHGEHDH